MKDILNDFETKTPVQNSASEEGFMTRLFEQDELEQSYFVINKFPKEFKKDLFRSLDLRFIIILILSFIFHVVAILFLEEEFPVQIDSETITKIQEQYVELLVDDGVTTTRSYELFDSDMDDLEPLDYETITGLTQWMEGISEDALESIKDMPVFSTEIPALSEAPIQETRIPTKEEMSSVRQFTEKARLQSLSEVEKEVGSIGLLGLIGSKTSRVDREYIDDLLGNADLNEDHLEKVLSKLSSIQVPHHNTAGYILNYKRNADISGGKLKGERKYAKAEFRNVIKNIAPLAHAKSSEIKRKTTYEKIATSNDALSKLNTKNLSGKKRSAKDVVRIVQSHKLALTDCYKSELKVNPTVQGKIIIRFTVDPTGNVVHVSVVSSTLNSPGMEKCIVKRIKNWRNFGYCDPSIGNVTYKQVFNFGGK